MTAPRLGKALGSFLEELESRTLMTVVNPDRPTNLTAIPLSSTSIELKWVDNVPNELSFRIYRTTDSPPTPTSVWTEVVSAPAGSIKWIDRNVVASTQYYYQIKSVTNVGLSEAYPRLEADNSDPLNPKPAETQIFATTLATDAFAQIDSQTNDLVVRGTTASDTIAITSTGGNIVVTVNGQAPLSFPTADVPRIQVYGSNGDDIITVGAGVNSTVSLVNISGGNGNDTITGGDGDDRIDGGNGRDSIDGGVGNDTITGGAGNDRLFGGADSDLLDGGAGNDKLQGGDGSDVLIGGTGHDQLLGEGGVDSLVGDAKYDILEEI